MSVIIFLIVLSILVLVHEFGHYIIARKNGIRVDEFGLGYPPRIWAKKFGETIFSINILPFGGFVRILGENPDEDTSEKVVSEESFQSKKKSVQAAVLVGGVGFNLIFAWLLISIGLMFGLPVLGGDTTTNDSGRLIVHSVSKNSPAEDAMIKRGDTIARISVNSTVETKPTPEKILNFVANNQEGEILLQITDKITKQSREVKLIPRDIRGDGKKLIGLSSEVIVKHPPHIALWEGAKMTLEITKDTALGITGFIIDLFKAQSNFSQMAGPVGIVGITGDAISLGIMHLIFFVAMISINLAVINLIPFPALDGGRLLFILIESIIGRPIKPKVVNITNVIGFALLLILMVAVTYNDIVNLL